MSVQIPKAFVSTFLRAFKDNILAEEQKHPGSNRIKINKEQVLTNFTQKLKIQSILQKAKDEVHVQRTSALEKIRIGEQPLSERRQELCRFITDQCIVFDGLCLACSKDLIPIKNWSTCGNCRWKLYCSTTCANNEKNETLHNKTDCRDLESVWHCVIQILSEKPPYKNIISICTGQEDCMEMNRIVIPTVYYVELIQGLKPADLDSKAMKGLCVVLICLAKDQTPATSCHGQQDSVDNSQDNISSQETALIVLGLIYRNPRNQALESHMSVVDCQETSNKLELTDVKEKIIQEAATALKSVKRIIRFKGAQMV